MEVDCEGCAGCCLDWRPIADTCEHERRGPNQPLDDVYNLVPLDRDDVRALFDAGLTDATIPRFWETDAGPSVEVDGHQIAAIEGKPLFFLGIRKVPKPVAPFDTDPQWLPTCTFLDPQTLQCRIHGEDEYPSECAAYPGHNLELQAETECERVEATFDGDRLLDAEPPPGLDGLLLGPQAIGQKVFVYAADDDLVGVIDRAQRNALTADDRARFAAAAAAGAPGSTEMDRNYFDAALEQAREAESWAGRSAATWNELAETADPDPALAAAVEEDDGAPGTPGWNV